jgi:hypothetical protein
MRIVWRLDKRGVAHACPAGWATALCGAQGREEVDHGSPCPRCIELATDRLLDED